MTTITWAVTAMNAYPQEAGNTDVVFNIHWTCSGVQDKFSASIYNTTQVPTPEGSFTPYAQLTQDQVLGWIWASGVDKAATEAAVQQQINNQINPPVVTPKLPWITA
jgi:hypothetical protein